MIILQGGLLLYYCRNDPRESSPIWPSPVADLESLKRVVRLVQNSFEIV